MVVPSAYNEDEGSKVETVIRCIGRNKKQMQVMKLDTRVNIFVRK